MNLAIFGNGVMVTVKNGFAAIVTELANDDECAPELRLGKIGALHAALDSLGECSAAVRVARMVLPSGRVTERPLRMARLAWQGLCSMR